MVLIRKYLYEDNKKFAENMDTSVSSIIQFEKFNSSVSRNFFIDYSAAITSIFHDSYFKILKQTRIEKKFTQNTSQISL